MSCRSWNELSSRGRIGYCLGLFGLLAIPLITVPSLQLIGWMGFLAGFVAILFFGLPLRNPASSAVNH